MGDKCHLRAVRRGHVWGRWEKFVEDVNQVKQARFDASADVEDLTGRGGVLRGEQIGLPHRAH